MLKNNEKNRRKIKKTGEYSENKVAYSVRHPREQHEPSGVKLCLKFNLIWCWYI